eukprot:3284092-Alexandrium_andersonii.AAC.1
MVDFDWRDLGAHADSTRRARGATLTRRLEAAAGTAARVERLPQQELRHQVVATRVLPQGLYG